MEIKREILGLFLLFGLLLIIPSVSAEVSFGRLDSTYNVGDEFNLSLGVSSASEASDFLELNIICFDFYKVETIVVNETNSSDGNSSSNSTTTITQNRGIAQIYKSPLSLDADQEKNIEVDIELDKFLIGNMTGECIVRSLYDGIEQDSQVFDISDELDVELDISGVVFGPEEEFTVAGEAYRKKGAPVEGFAEAKIEALNMSVIGIVSNGTFNFNFTIPRDAHAGKYEINVRVYERDNNRLLINEGEGVGEFKVNQINEEMKIAVESRTIVPGNNYVFNVLLYDQAGDEVISDVSTIVYYPDLAIAEKRLVRTGTSQSIEIPKNSTPGYWRVDASIDDITASKTFFVEELMEVSFELKNNTLVVENMGNVPYSKPIEVNIGGNTELVDVNVMPNGVQKFRVSAPDGEYEVSVNDGNEERLMGTSFLTGNAISVRDVATLGGGLSGIIIWIIVILVFAAIAVYLYRKVRKKNFFGKKPSFKPEKKRFLDKFKRKDKVQGNNGKPFLYKPTLKSKVMGMVHHEKKAPVQTETSNVVSSGNVDNGEKQKVSIIALKIKNMHSLGGTNAHGSIDQALSKAKSLGSKIYIDGDYRIVIFSKSTSGEGKNSLRTVKAAKKIEEILTAHNKVYTPKIQFGIGVNIGEMIVESKEGKLRFTSIGNTISSAKRISEDSKEEVLLSNQMHRELAGSVKGESEGQNWKLKKISDREEHSEFIKRFVNRQKD